MNVKLLLLVASIVIFALGAILGFGWIGSSADIKDVLAVDSLGLAVFAGSFLPV